jgi:hypothetical protein
VAWPDEILDLRSARMAEAILGLLSDAPRWRHRRVETLTVLSSTLLRRRVSVDFTVPSEYHDGLRLPVSAHRRSDRDQWVVPLGWLARRQLVNFDLEGRTGRALPLLLGAQTAILTRDVLFLAALSAGFDPAVDDVDELLDLVDGAVGETPVDDPVGLQRRAEQLRLGSDFATLVRSSSYGFLLLAVVEDVKGRQVVKWQNDEVRPDTGFVLWHRVPFINEVESSHVELELPDVLEAPRFELWDDRVSEEGSNAVHDTVRLAAVERQGSLTAERPRLLLGGARSARRPHVRADLRVATGEFLMPAFVLAAVAFLVLLVGVASDVASEITEENSRGTASASATVLLSTFAALSGLVLRVESHPLVRALLSGPRRALGFTAVALIGAAAPIGLQLDTWTIRGAWIFAMLAALCSVGLLGDAIYDHGARGDDG